MPTSRLAVAVNGQAEPGCTVGSLSGRASNLIASGVAVELVRALVGETDPVGSPASPQPASRSATAPATTARLIVSASASACGRPPASPPGGGSPAAPRSVAGGSPTRGG